MILCPELQGRSFLQFEHKELLYLVFKKTLNYALGDSASCTKMKSPKNVRLLEVLYPILVFFLNRLNFLFTQFESYSEMFNH